MLRRGGRLEAMRELEVMSAGEAGEGGGGDEPGAGSGGAARLEAQGAKQAADEVGGEALEGAGGLAGGEALHGREDLGGGELEGPNPPTPFPQGKGEKRITRRGGVIGVRGVMSRGGQVKQGLNGEGGGVRRLEEGMAGLVGAGEGKEAVEEAGDGEPGGDGEEGRMEVRGQKSEVRGCR